MLYISVGVVLGDIAVSSWATLLCRRGRHCSVVVGDIALELCTGQKEPKIATSVVPGSGRSPVSLPPYTPHRNLWCGAKPRLIAALYPQPQSGFGAKPRLIAALELCTKKEKKKKKPFPHTPYKEKEKKEEKPDPDPYPVRVYVRVCAYECGCARTREPLVRVRGEAPSHCRPESSPKTSIA